MLLELQVEKESFGYSEFGELVRRVESKAFAKAARTESITKLHRIFTHRLKPGHNKGTIGQRWVETNQPSYFGDAGLRYMNGR